MDIVLSVLASEIVSRSISSVIAKYEKQSSMDNKLSRLEQVLLRANTIVEEAEGKHISNQGMILQLRQLRKNMYRAYYVLDTYKRRLAAVSQPLNLNKLCVVFENLEDSVNNMKEFVRFLMDCPRIFRQPYSTYLFMDKCMFGRHAEKEQIINFLLQTCNSSLSVLPIVGAPEIGKRTLVEHVCKEERVREQFSQIVHIRSNGMNQQLETDAHSTSELVVSSARSLIVVDLGHYGDDATWRRVHSLICHTYSGKSRVLLISTAEEVSRLGTTKALRMKKLHRDEYWYYFKTIAFGSANPDDHHQLLPSIARKIVTHIDGSFIAANVIARLLQADLSEALWRYVSEYVKKTTHYHQLVHGCCAQDRIRKDRPFYLGNHVYGPLLLCYQRHETAGPLMESELPKIKGADLITRGSAIPREGKLEVLRWQSTIPPYLCYIASCEGQNPQQVIMPKEKHQNQKRKRQL